MKITTKKTYNPLWWSVAAVLVGLLLVIWPESILRWAVIFIGIISLLGGLMQVITYFVRRSRGQNSWGGFPLIGLLAVIWGVMLLAQQEVWVGLFMVVLSLPMILLAIDQMISLGRSKRLGTPVRWTYYIFPVLFLLAGVIVLFNPFTSATVLLIFVGAWIIAYGIIDMFNYFISKSRN